MMSLYFVWLFVQESKDSWTCSVIRTFNLCENMWCNISKYGQDTMSVILKWMIRSFYGFKKNLMKTPKNLPWGDFTFQECPIIIKIILCCMDLQESSDGSRSKLFVAWVTWEGSSQPSLVWVWKISPKKLKFFNFFFSDQKNLTRLGQKVPGSKTGWPLIYCGSKVCWGWVWSRPISIRVPPYWSLWALLISCNLVLKNCWHSWGLIQQA